MDQKIYEIKTLLLKGIKNHDFPGASLSMFDSKKAYHLSLGYKMLEPKKVEVSGDEIYDIASLTKVVFTTTAVMQLIEKNVLSLNTPITSILDWFKHKDITIYDLLIHSSGLPADIKKSYTYQTKDQIINTLKKMDVIYEKGKHIVYSDCGFILLGLVIEKVTNMSLDEYGQTYIFKPLGMHDTTFFPKVKRCAPTEFRSDETFKGLLQGKVHDEKAFALGEAGHAGLFSTSKDLLLFCQSLLFDEQILSRKSIELLLKIQITKNDLNHQLKSRAIGWQKPTGITYAGDYINKESVLMHTGFTGCHMVICFQQKKAYVCLSNAVHPKREKNKIVQYRRKLSNIILGE